MKIIFITILLLILAFIPTDAQGKITVAVFEIEAKYVSPSGVDILTNVVRSEILKLQEYDLVDRDLMSKALKEQNFQYSSSTSVESIVKAGKILGIKKIITCNIGKLGSLYIINLQMIDVESGKIEKSETNEFIGELEYLRTPVRNSVQKLISINEKGISTGSFINISSEPKGAKVYVNGIFKGNTPVDVSIEETGKKLVRIVSDEYVPWEQHVYIKKDSTSFVNATLLKKQPNSINVSERLVNQDGRRSLISFMSLYSIFLANGTLFTMGVDSKRQYIGGTLIAAPLGFFITLKATRNASISVGRANMITSSAVWGALWGVSAVAIVKPKSDRPYVGLSLLGGFTAIYISTLATRDIKISKKRVSLINLGAFLGSLFGLGVPYVFDIKDDRVYFGSILAFSLSGGAYAIKLTKDFDKVYEESTFKNLNSVVNIDHKKIRFGLPIYSLAGILSSYLTPRAKYNNSISIQSWRVNLINVKF